MGFYVPSYDEATELDLATRHLERETPLGAYLGAKVKETFNRTLGGFAVDKATIASREREAYGAAAIDVEIQNLSPISVEAVADIKKYFISKEDFEKTKFFEQGVKWREGMTPVRAEYQAEEIQKRNYQQSLIDRSPDGLRNILGFGASIVGSLADPLTYVPLGGVGRAATILEATAGAAKAGALVGFAQTAITHEHLENYGEDIEFIDYVINTGFGATAGAFFGATGKAAANLSNRMRATAPAAERQAVADMAELSLQQVNEGNSVNINTLYDNAGGLRQLRQRLSRTPLLDEVTDPLHTPTTLEQGVKIIDDSPSTFAVATERGEQPIVRDMRNQANRIPEEESAIIRAAIPDEEVSRTQAALNCLIGG